MCSQMGVGAIFVSTFAVTELPKPHSPPENQAELLAATIQTIVAFVVLGSIVVRKSMLLCQIPCLSLADWYIIKTDFLSHFSQSAIAPFLSHEHGHHARATAPRTHRSGSTWSANALGMLRARTHPPFRPSWKELTLSGAGSNRRLTSTREARQSLSSYCKQSLLSRLRTSRNWELRPWSRTRFVTCSGLNAVWISRKLGERL